MTPGRVLAADLGKLSQTATELGETAKIRMSGDRVTINDANLTLTDVESSNGVIRPIDTLARADHALTD